MKAKTILSRTGVVIGAVITFLWLTNPSYARFKEFGADVSTAYQKVIFKRTSNFIVFSIYHKQVISSDGGWTLNVKSDERYIGFVMNFYKIK